MTYIYTISCPITQDVVYVGKTINPTSRVYTHRAARGCTKICTWVREMQKTGHEIHIDIIDQCENNEFRLWERFYIELHRAWGFELLNTYDYTNAKPFSHSLLKQRIKSHSGTLSNFCRKNHLSYNYFTHKIQGRARFTRNELLAINKILP